MVPLETGVASIGQDFEDTGDIFENLLIMTEFYILRAFETTMLCPAQQPCLEFILVPPIYLSSTSTGSIANTYCL